MAFYSEGSGKAIDIVDFAPDLDPRANKGFGTILDMTNAVPSIAGYRSRPSPVAQSDQLPETPLGAYIALYSDGSTSVFAGGANHLWRLVGGTWVQADTVSSYGVSSGARWRFTQFNDDVIATNQSVTSPQVATGIAGTFTNLTGNPPANPHTIIAVGEGVMAFAGTNWYFSAVGSDNNWTPNLQTQAGFGPLTDFPGPIVAAAPFFRTAIVFKMQAAWILTFIGADTIWQNQLIANATGTWNQECVVLGPEQVAFLGNDDFWVTQGYAPTRIPNNLKEWFFLNLYRDNPQKYNPIYLFKSWSWYDPENAIYYWHFVSNKAPYPGGVCDRYVAFNIRAQRWGTGYLLTPCVVPNTQPGRTTGLYFDVNNVLQSWSGPPGAMTLLTGFAGDESKLSQLMKVRICYANGMEPASENIQPFHVNTVGEQPIVGPVPILGADDWFNFRQYDRFHQLLVTTTGMTEITGFAGEARVGGTR